MNRIKKIYCRVFQFAFRAALPFLPYRQPEIFASVRELESLFQKKKVKSVLLVSAAAQGRGYQKS